MDGVDRPVRRVLFPYLVDQTVDRHHLVRSDRQHGEHGTLTRAAESRGRIVDAHLDRPENPQLKLRPHGANANREGTDWGFFGRLFARLYQRSRAAL